MKDLGKREAQIEYKGIIDEQKIQHKREVTNLKEQYEYLLSEKEKELEKFVNEFKVYHAQKKGEIHNARDEIVNLYKVCKKLNKVVENVENGVYSNGIRSAYIPQKDKAKIPDRYECKFLNKALNCTKTITTAKTWKHNEEDERASIIEGEYEVAGTAMRDTQKRSSKTMNDSNADSNGVKSLASEGAKKESIEQIISERDKFKSMYQSEVTKNNNNMIVIQSQKRLLEKTKVETMAKKAGSYGMMRPKTQGRFV